MPRFIFRAGLAMYFGASALWLACASSGCQVLSEEQRQAPETRRDGRALFDVHCGQCHDRPEPCDCSDSGWVPVVRDMGRRAQLTPLQAEKILAYLQSANGE